MHAVRASVNGSLIVSQEVLPGIVDSLASGANIEQAEDKTFATNTPGTITLDPVCGTSGSSIKVSIASTTSSSTFLLVSATYKPSGLASSTQSISPLVNAGSCVLAIEAWNGSTQKFSFDGDYAIEFDLSATEYERFKTGELSLYTFSTSTSKWVEVSSVIKNDTAHTLRVSLNHLSMFAALGTLKPSAVTSVVQAASLIGGGSLPIGFPLSFPVRTPLVPVVRVFPPFLAAVPVMAPPVLTPTTTPPASPLFDIRAMLTKIAYTIFDEPEVVVTFSSFGAVPASVDLGFELVDSTGKVVTRTTDLITVETEGVYRKKFPKLPIGNYRLTVTTNYAKVVNDHFTLGFGVSGTKMSLMESVKQYVVNRIAGPYAKLAALVSITSIALVGILLFAMKWWRRWMK